MSIVSSMKRHKKRIKLVRFVRWSKLVAKRGQYMTQAAPTGSGKMVAVMNTSAEIIEEACNEARQYGIVSPANYNTPGQIVIGGEKDAVDQLG